MLIGIINKIIVKTKIYLNERYESIIDENKVPSIRPNDKAKEYRPIPSNPLLSMCIKGARKTDIDPNPNPIKQTEIPKSR